MSLCFLVQIVYDQKCEIKKLKWESNMNKWEKLKKQQIKVKIEE
jgi:hypothetical protein